MNSNKWITIIISTAVFIAGVAVGTLLQPIARAQTAGRVFEIRTYTAAEGKLQALHARFLFSQQPAQIDPWKARANGAEALEFTPITIEA